MGAVENAFAILEAVAQLQPTGVSDLARRLEMSKSTAQRSLVTLESAGWVARSTDDPTKWLLTSRALTIGTQYRGTHDIRQLTKAVMTRLADTCNETIHLSIPEHAEVVLIERIESLSPVRVHSMVGDRYPMHRTSAGIAILSARQPDSVSAFLEWADTVRPAGQPPIDIEAIIKLVDQARADGYAVTHRTRHPDVSAIGAPIRGQNGEPVAALSISMQAERLTAKTQRAFSKELVAAATECSGIYVQSAARQLAHLA